MIENNKNVRCGNSGRGKLCRQNLGYELSGGGNLCWENLRRWIFFRGKFGRVFSCYVNHFHRKPHRIIHFRRLKKWSFLILILLVSVQCIFAWSGKGLGKGGPQIEKEWLAEENVQIKGEVLSEGQEVTEAKKESGGLFFYLPSSYSPEICVFDTELEFLWDRAKAYSYEQEVLRNSENEAKRAYKYKASLYSFSFSSSLSSSFSDIYEGLEWYSDSSSGEISLSKKNPGGNLVKGGINYSLSRGVLNYFEEINSSNIGYIQRPGINLSVSQSLLPFYFQGEKEDPGVAVLKENLRLSQLTFSQSEKTLLENVTQKYIQYRAQLRLIKKEEAYMDFYDERIKAAKEMHKNGQISMAEIWELENAKSNYFTEYLGYENTRDEIEAALKSLVGWEVELLTDENLILPDNFLRTGTDGTDKGDMPSEESGSIDKARDSLNKNPEIQKIRSQQKILELQNVMNRQNYAPNLQFSGTFAESLDLKDSLLVNYWEDKSAFSWSFSLALTFDDFLSPSRKLRKENYLDKKDLYRQALENTEEKIKNQRNTLSMLIASCGAQLEKAEKLRENREALLKNYRELLKKGSASRMDILGMEVQAEEARSVCENLKDMLWFYRWKLAFDEEFCEI